MKNLPLECCTGIPMLGEITVKQKSSQVNEPKVSRQNNK